MLLSLFLAPPSLLVPITAPRTTIEALCEGVYQHGCTRGEGTDTAPSETPHTPSFTFGAAHHTSRRGILAAIPMIGLQSPSPCRASEYQDAATVVAAQFAAAEAARGASAARVAAGKVEFERRVFTLEASFGVDSFVEASDALALYVAGTPIPEGVNIGFVVARLRATYNALPRYAYECERGTRTNCYNHGEKVERAYAALLRELKKSSRRSFDPAVSGGSELPNSAGVF